MRAKTNPELIAEIERLNKLLEGDPLQLLSNLPSDRNYTQADRYHDFRKVFNGAEGQRVFRELLSWGHLFAPTIVGSPVDPYQLAIRGAEHNYALRLLSTYTKEPAIQANTQKRTKNED